MQDNLDREAIAKNFRLIADAVGYSTGEFAANKTVSPLAGKDLLMGFGKRKRKTCSRKANGFAKS